jgi:Late exocytosis, associated with Golgi transport
MSDSTGPIYRSLSTDDSVNNYQDTNTLLNTLSVNSILFAVFLLLFEINRHMKPIYLKRFNKKFIRSNRVPDLPPTYPLGWVVAIASIEDDEIIRMVGMDGYMLLRYILLCFRFSIFVSFFGLVVLAPVYKQAGPLL